MLEYVWIWLDWRDGFFIPCLVELVVTYFKKFYSLKELEAVLCFVGFFFFFEERKYFHFRPIIFASKISNLLRAKGYQGPWTLIYYYKSKKKWLYFWKSAGWIFLSLAPSPTPSPASLHSQNANHNIFLFKIHKHKQKAKETKEEKEKGNIVVVNSICRKFYRIWLYFVCKFLTYVIESLISHGPVTRDHFKSSQMKNIFGTRKAYPSCQNRISYLYFLEEKFINIFNMC